MSAVKNYEPPTVLSEDSVLSENMVSTQSRLLTHFSSEVEGSDIAEAKHRKNRCLRYFILFSLLWIVLTQADPASWLIGIFVVPFATWSTLRLFPVNTENSKLQHQQIKPGALPRFLGFFFKESLKGGWESAVFATHPWRRPEPGFFSYDMQLPEGRPKLFFVNLVSLLPGTVSAVWDGERLKFHALDKNSNHQQALRSCELEVAKLFGVALSNDKKMEAPEAENMRAEEII